MSSTKTDFPKKLIFPLIAITIIYWVGIFAISIHQLSILKYTPANLIVSFLIIYISIENLDKTMYLIFILYLLGFSIEVIGTNTGYPFGEYRYGHNLGFLIWNTPILMGVNWLITVLTTFGISNFLKTKHFIIKPIIASLLMLILDFLIEPCCQTLDFWIWAEHHPPIQNYIAWAILGFCFQWILQKKQIEINKIVCFWLYTLQILFFLVSFIYLL